MKTELKITKGKVEIANLDREIIHNEIIDGKGKIVARCPYYKTDETTIANAELICEAFNVANETGLTPKMMQEQNEKMFRLIESFLKTGYYDTATGNEAIEFLQSIQKGETSK